MFRLIIFCNFLVLLVGCNLSSTDKKLPILGDPIIVGNDTNYPIVPNFEFRNQNNQLINNNTFKDKIYIASFIFLDCPTICPKMTKETEKVYKHYLNDNRIAFMSHTIDPEHDTIQKLKAYANRLGISHSKWHFVTGEKKEIYDIAENGYFTIAGEDSTAPGGYIHGGGLLLVDKHRHIRGVYDGTDKKETKRLIKDIELLVKE